jgi:hypothetical protein
MVSYKRQEKQLQLHIENQIVIAADILKLEKGHPLSKEARCGALLIVMSSAKKPRPL